jgi:hypothetical protein
MPPENFDELDIDEDGDELHPSELERAETAFDEFWSDDLNRPAAENPVAAELVPEWMRDAFIAGWKAAKS